MDIIEALLGAGATLSVYDPVAMENIRKKFSDRIGYGMNQYEVLHNADGLLILTEWSEFRNPDFDKMKRLLKEYAIFDGRNVYALEKMREMNFHYESIGREIVDHRSVS